MINRLWGAVALVAAAHGLAAPAGAQTSKAKEETAAAEAAAAMERARKQAASPMRIILEAAKAKRRPGEEAAPQAPTTASSTETLRPVASRSAAAPPSSTAAPAAATTVAAPVAAAVATTPAPAPIAPPQPTVAPSPAPAPAPAQATLTSGSLQSATLQAVPGLTGTGVASAVPLAPLAKAAPVALAAPEPQKPTLLSMVEPEVTQRLLDEMGRNAVVALDLTIRPDGSVAQVAMVSAGSRQLQRALMAAVEQWRFAPLPTQRQHRVELVFNSDR